MASSSVSQEDVENDFEKLEKRSRIRTARARQINPQGCRVEASCTAPLTLDIDTELSELHLEPVSISPYTLPGASGQVQPDTITADTSPKGRDMIGNNRKDSVRTTERSLANKPHHGIKGKQQRDRRKLREKRRSTGVVHLASTESTGGSTSGEEELSECEIGGETKRNTAQNESIGEGLLVDAETCHNAHAQQESRGDTCGVTERKNSGRGPYNSNSYNRARLRSKNATRSEDMEADDELGDKTDNDHERMSPNSTTPKFSPPIVCSQAVVSESDVVRTGASSDPDLMRQLQEKDRRIQYLELKIQQLSQDSANIIAEHEKLKQENSVLVAALKKNAAEEDN